ncbi:MAG: octanoyltransferase [Candidatus Muproteobacteria bacterium RBG_16_64_11]|uniref:Octanoyltransferase n=1 Tax=Candidatus Muproteobacteria bacterium RBG_16_64_11 TaxID=1817758 RepID=A0A1F6THU5_9PROT|nr:MAG: octanoyltransferase [Candidatus Muproteobacteria bacterium RBG_16_64_11]
MSRFDASTVTVRDLGVVDYQACLRAMQDFTIRRGPATGDELWLLQHPPVYTLGLNARQAVLANPTGIPVVKCDRGGDISYHGPGQLVAYVLIDLRRRGWGVKQLVHALEQSVLDFLGERAIEAGRRPGAPGVYVDGRKIAQLGLRIRRGASYHGLSFNIDMDLAPFRQIRPCGIEGLEVTQLAALPGGKIPLNIAADGLRTQLLRRLEYNHTTVSSPDPA